ncbi:hypothetical protein Zmor_022304 [Zophobas morio]|uniref:Cytochrome P450 n=1 Tax=Zophobas morio TaxID=2755281 RepID=A0AA38HVG1_9CUCU|nr:hypothetical protein Zmor_022304 [Zophobas morio]
MLDVYVAVRVLLTGTFTYLLCVFLQACWNKRRLYYCASKVKGPLAFPVIGSAYLFFGGTQNIFENFIRLGKKYGYTYKLWLGNRLYFVVSKPEDVQMVLNSTVDRLSNIKFLIPAFGNGLLTLPGDEWKSHRKLLNVAFNQKILNSFVGTFASYSNVLVDKLEAEADDNFFDLVPILTRCTVDILIGTTMGVNLNIMKGGGHNLISWTSRLSELAVLRMAKPHFQPEFLWKRMSMAKESKILSEKVHNFIKRIVEMKRSETAQNVELSGTKRIFLEQLLKLEDSEAMWNRETSIEETQTILVTGSDSTAVTIGFVLMMLGMHQDIQNKTYEELVCVFGDSQREVSLEDLHQLTYLERVIKETLRLFPIGPVLGRHLTSDLVLGDYVCPKGSSILIPIIAIHRDGKVWPEPLKFKPDRFLPNEISKRHPCSFLWFSSGPRNCIGFRFATMAIKTVLATVLRHYRVVETEYSSISEIQLKMDVATKCVNGQNVKLQKRLQQ